MIRLLIIGRDAEQWRRGLNDWAGKTLDVACETLPAAGIRNFGDSSPDAVAVAEPDQSPKIEPIVEAIRERPLGQIVPVVLLGASYVEDDDLHIASAVGADEGPEGLVGRLESILDVDLAPSPRHAETMEEPDLEVERTEEGDRRTFQSTEIPTPQAEGGAPDPGVSENVDPRGARPPSREATAGGESAPRQRSESGTIEHPNYILEPLDDEGPSTASGSSGSTGLDEMSSDLRSVAPPDGAAIRRKLKEVRHEDYFVILGVRRGAEADEVRQAYRDMKARFREDRLDFDLAEKFEAELEEINDALDDARAVLGDERLRRAYRDGTTRA